MKKVKYLLYLLVLMVFLLMGCKKEEESVVEGTGVFYLNTEGTGLTKKAYTLKGSKAEEQVEELLAELTKETDSIDYVSVLPVDVEIESWELNGTKLNLYFNVCYNNMDAASEVLLHTAIVQTLTQIEKIEYIAFFAAGQPVTDDKGNEIGYLKKDDFVYNIGPSLHSYQKAELNLYFADKDGKYLKKENVSVRYNSNMSVEKLIVEELIEGPGGNDLLATFSPKTKVLGVSVKDGICYVNFDEDFLKDTVAINPKLTVYSLVNSIVESGNATNVQILVNGEMNIKYQEAVDLNQLFSRNLDIIEGAE